MRNFSWWYLMIWSYSCNQQKIKYNNMISSVQYHRLCLCTQIWIYVCFFTYKCQHPIHASKIQNDEILFAFCVALPEKGQKCTNAADGQWNDHMSAAIITISQIQFNSMSQRESPYPFNCISISILNLPAHRNRFQCFEMIIVLGGENRFEKLFVIHCGCSPTGIVRKRKMFVLCFSLAFDTYVFVAKPPGIKIKTEIKFIFVENFVKMAIW